MPASRTCPAHALRNAPEPAIYRAVRAVGAVGIGDARAAIRDYLERHRYRRDLRRLLRAGPHMIDDIGLTRSEAQQEVEKPFWRP
jgi:uncharacterized protein YjiS (DUF1127 family)